MISTRQPDQATGSRPDTAARAALAVAVAAVLIRSALFLVRPHVAFDSDQAVMGLMARHLVEGRAFPMYLYGQSYILGVEAWLAAPVFLIAGTSIPALKLPVFIANIALAVLLVRGLIRAGAPPQGAVVASLFFLLPPPGTTASFLETSGGTVEPLLYVVLLWLLRRRSGWFGFVLAVGFMQREFTAYALPALALVLAATGELWTRDTIRALLRGVRVAFELWLVAQWLHGFSSAAGPGTTVADLTTPASGLTDVAQRFCLDPRTFGYGIARVITIHWPALFGTSRTSLADLGLSSRLAQGFSGLGPLLGGVMLLMLARVAMHVRFERPWWNRHAFFAYLTAVGALSAAVYAVGRCGNVGVPTMRHDLMSVLGAVGVAGWFMAVEQRRVLRGLAAAAIALWAVGAAVPHVQLWAEHARGNPTDTQRVIDRLEARGVRYVIATYGLAYYIDFATRERIIASAEDYSRIREYDRLVAAHRAEAVRIQRAPCEGGYAAMPGVYFCPP